MMSINGVGDVRSKHHRGTTKEHYAGIDGVRFNEMPLTSERIVATLREAEAYGKLATTHP